MFPASVQLPVAQRIVAPPAGPNAAYGEYLVNISNCRDCHGENLAGKPDGLGPGGPDLTRVLPKWSDADFMNLLRSGKTPDGKSISNDDMPWKDFSGVFSDDDIRALSAYIRTLTPVNAEQ